LPQHSLPHSVNMRSSLRATLDGMVEGVDAV
jgi:hypothetical protein